MTKVKQSPVYPPIEDERILTKAPKVDETRHLTDRQRETALRIFSYQTPKGNPILDPIMTRQAWKHDQLNWDELAAELDKLQGLPYFTLDPEVAKAALSNKLPEIVEVCGRPIESISINKASNNRPVITHEDWKKAPTLEDLLTPEREKSPSWSAVLQLIAVFAIGLMAAGGILLALYNMTKP